MKFFTTIVVVVQAVLIQNAYSQVIRAAASPCSSYGSAIIAQPSVASSLADTLSLLTVSSLLAETLPLNPNIIAAVPAPAISYGGCGSILTDSLALSPNVIATLPASAYAPAISYGGCGCGCGNRYSNYYNYLY